MSWWRQTRKTLYFIWFAGWLVLGPALLALLGQEHLAKQMTEWRAVLIPVSAGLVHYAHYRDEGPHAFAFGFLLFISFLVLRYGPAPDDPTCVADEDSTCAGGNTYLAVGTAIAAAVLTYYRPALTALTKKVENHRVFLYTVDVSPAEVGFIELYGRARTADDLAAK